MATTSTPEQNDPEADNRQEYELPPVTEEVTAGVEFDSDGFATGDSGSDDIQVSYDAEGVEVYEELIVEEEEGDYTLAAR